MSSLHTIYFFKSKKKRTTIFFLRLTVRFFLLANLVYRAHDRFNARSADVGTFSHAPELRACARSNLHIRHRTGV